MSRIVILTPVIPEAQATNAGEKLVYNHACALRELGHTVSFISTSGNLNISKKNTFNKLVLSTYSENQSTITRLVSRMRRPFKAWLPNIEFLIDIICEPKAIKLIKDADIIDLQWAEMVLLTPFLRIINPKTKVIGTFHDINSQRYFRRNFYEVNKLKKIGWIIQYNLSKWFEKKIINYLTHVIVLSKKDKLLLDRNDNINSLSVVAPPVYSSTDNFALFTKNLSTHPSIIFLGSLYRWENLEALQWLLTKVMPSIWRAYPTTILQIVGPVGNTSQIEGSEDERVKFLGVIENLYDAYKSPWVAAVPVRLGGGVKFKTIDALQYSTPVVATTAGVEGLGNIDWVCKRADSSTEFAKSIIDIFQNKEIYLTQARINSRKVRSFYSADNYSKAIEGLYGK